jgi:RNA polymerase sigma factor (sigma-70 family)
MSAREERTRTHDRLARYLTGDHEAERRLFEAQRAELSRRASSSSWMAGLSAHVTPEDLVDEVFLRVLESGLLRSFHDPRPGALADLLGTVLEGVATDAYRRAQALKRGGGTPIRSLDGHGKAGDTTGDGLAVASREPTPTSDARASELVQLCRTVLEPREWEVWRLIEQEGLHSSTVARRLGTSDAAVRGLFRRARLRILRVLAKEQGDHSSP